MFLCDREIIKLAQEGMIEPFKSRLIREIDNRKIISYGLGSFGYDLRLSQHEFYIFRRQPGEIVNPKRFTTNHLQRVTSRYDNDGYYFVLPANSYGLGVTVEKLNLPRDITVIFIGKSTYARCGIIVNLTPGEAGWVGHLTLEISNASSADTRIYANEGICQALFARGNEPNVSYCDREGKYQNQQLEVTTAKL